VLTAFQDITDRKRAEEALRKSERRLSLAVSATTDAIWEWNVQTDAVYFSPRWYEMLGYRDQELPMVIETWRQLCHLEDYQATADLLQEVARLSRSTGCTAEFRMRAKDGSWVWVQGRCNVVEWNAEGKALLVSGANTDITERKRNEEELRRHRDHLETLVAERTAQLQAANRDLSEFAYVVSHDLKAPLRAVSQLAHWIAEDYATILDDEGKTKLELMRGRITRMYNLIDGILEYSRIGRLEGKPEAVNLDTLVREVIEVLDPPAHIQVRVETPLPTVTANRTRMEQLFQNLIGNAIKFMDKPVGLVTVACEEAGDFWRFRVTDNGPGIEPKYHEKVFGIFQTLVARDRQESTGIGLTLVKKIVELYHGEITLISEPGQGATFSFTLPR
jgi:PAS domain S-box-containing protein